jgi:hypothetical protein
MTAKTGLTRIALLLIWFLFCVILSLGILYCMGPPFTFTDIMLALTFFFLFFYAIAVVFLVMVDFSRPEAERWWDPFESTSQIIFWIAILTGLCSLSIIFLINSTIQMDMSYGVIAFVFPFGFIISNYIFFCWIKDGFQQ